MSDFHVKYTRIFVQDLIQPLHLLILKKICSHAANTIYVQCGHEYNFESDDTKVEDHGAAKLQSLPVELLQVLPKSNLDCERDLSEFDRRAVFA